MFVCLFANTLFHNEWWQWWGCKMPKKFNHSTKMPLGSSWSTCFITCNCYSTLILYHFQNTPTNWRTLCSGSLSAVSVPSVTQIQQMADHVVRFQFGYCSTSSNTWSSTEISGVLAGKRVYIHFLAMKLNSSNMCRFIDILIQVGSCRKCWYCGGRFRCWLLQLHSWCKPRS